MNLAHTSFPVRCPRPDAGQRPISPGPERSSRARAPRGARVRIVTTDQTSDVDAQNLELAATLRRLGYRVTVTHYSTDLAYFNEVFNTSKRVDAVVNGWFQDFPAPSNYFGGINCPTSPYYCSPAYRRRFGAVVAAATARDSNEPWTRFDREVTDSAAVVPYDNLKSVDFVSKRVGNYQHHPEFDLLIDQLWVR
jgi:peptide/nickel transport system substrate-binding protein